MADSPRIEDLRRRVQKDPASIAFAQLAEEYRRAGQHAEAIDVWELSVAPPPVHPPSPTARHTPGDPDQVRAIKILAVLEQWLAAIHVARADRHP